MQTIALNKDLQLLESLKIFARDIKLSHSIFALPFVGVALTITGAADINFVKILKIIVCMVTARSFAMGANRYLDKDIDAVNQRTRSRALPSGLVNPKSYLAITLLFGGIFIITAFSLSNLAGFLSPFLLLILAFYSLMKKISWLTHWYLGLCLGLAPVATQLALFDTVTLPIVLIGLAVAAWTAGFDLLYSLQDREFDQAHGLHSAPAKVGYRAAIWLSRGSFLLMILMLFVAGWISSVGAWWHLGVAAVAMILISEHWLIRGAMETGKSDKINMAFFNLNALVSVFFFIFSLADAYVRG